MNTSPTLPADVRAVRVAGVECFTLADAQRLSGLSVSGFRVARREGRGPFRWVRFGSRVYFPVDDFWRWMDSRAVFIDRGDA